MSRRSRRREGESTRERAERRPQGAPEPPSGDPLSNLGVQLVLLAAVFVVAVLVAELFGAANLGVAFGVGQIAVAVAVVYLILRR